MKFVLALLFSSFATAAPILPDQELPKEAPLSAVMVVQCDHILGIFGTMADGHIVSFTASSKVPFDKAFEWGLHAKEHLTVTAKCVLEDANVATTTS